MGNKVRFSCRIRAVWEVHLTRGKWYLDTTFGRYTLSIVLMNGWKYTCGAELLIHIEEAFKEYPWGHERLKSIRLRRRGRDKAKDIRDLCREAKLDAMDMSKLNRKYNTKEGYQRFDISICDGISEIEELIKNL